VSIARFHRAVTSGQIFQKYSYVSAASRSRLRWIVSLSATSATMTRFAAFVPTPLAGEYNSSAGFSIKFTENRFSILPVRDPDSPAWRLKPEWGAPRSRSGARAKSSSCEKSTESFFYACVFHVFTIAPEIVAHHWVVGVADGYAFDPKAGVRMEIVTHRLARLGREALSGSGAADRRVAQLLYLDSS
jgi:hypothetical protein